VHPEKFKQVMGLPSAERHGCAQACASGDWEHSSRAPSRSAIF
jgi:hypothetical protein